MKKEKKQIDQLLRRNESEQLARVDWDRLHASISKSLNEADRNKISMMSYRQVFKIAAGFAAAAAVIFIAVMIKTNIPTKGQFENDQKGMVAFIESKSSAKVKILEPKEQGDYGEDQATWIIIRLSKPKGADNGQVRDENDFACLM